LGIVDNTSLVVWGKNLQSTRWARNYSTLATTRRSVENLKLNPWSVTGFTDGEGCFNVSIAENKNFKLGWKVQPRFQLVLHKKDHPVLKLIKNYFSVGEISKGRPQTL